MVPFSLQWRAMDQQETIMAEQTVRDQVCSEVAKTITWLQQTKATQVLPPTIGVSADDVRRHLDEQKVGGGKRVVNYRPWQFVDMFHVLSSFV